MTEILVTGANGFIGQRLCDELARRGEHVRRALRVATGADSIAVGEISAHTDWSAALQGVHTVVHLAGRAHQLHDPAKDPLTDFRRVNVDGSMQLARLARNAGVARLIFLSSIGVNGAETHDKPFTADDVPAPHSPYARSKFEAEQMLQQLAREGGPELTIIRPPLVIGPRAPGNFGRLVRLVAHGVPLPLAAIRNRRSFVALDNLVDLIALCVRDPRAAGQLLLASDDEDVSTPQLVRGLGAAMSRPARLFPVPTSLLRAGASLAGRASMAQQLCGSLQVDSSATRALLGWSPPVGLAESLRRAAAAH